MNCNKTVRVECMDQLYGEYLFTNGMEVIVENNGNVHGVSGNSIAGIVMDMASSMDRNRYGFVHGL